MIQRLRASLRNWWVQSVAEAVLGALILALLLPLVVAELRPPLVRAVMVLLVAITWTAAAFRHLAKDRKASDAIAEEIARPDPAAAADPEAAALAARMKDALGGLKGASGKRRDYLYSRPWYVIIGPPGAGKTTALLNSGLRFPFSDTALKGVGGTRDLDFWFADEAVLVDTAGRYTSQDSDAAADAKGWTGFLGLLRRHRPLQPVNGVLVAIGLDELMGADRAAIDRHAAAVRRRLEELQSTLELKAPVYVLFTKADLLAGFAEFFDDLDVEGRRAVLGATLPWPSAPDGPELARRFDEVAAGVSARAAKRLQDEPDGRRRALVLGFPSQWEALRPRLLRFLEGAFLPERGERAPLRGFYLTSGVQQGAPLDRILGGMAQVYDAPAQAVQGGGRAYFLNRLLSEVVFPEAGLVQAEAGARRRRSAQLAGAMAAVGVAALVVLGLWLVSFAGNRGLQGRLASSAQGVQSDVRTTGIDLVEVRESDPDLEQSLSVLRALRDLPQGYGERHRHGPPLLMTFGLYQSGESRAAEAAYRQGLQRILLPRILLRLEKVLHDRQASPLEAYEPLKVYLMLGGQGPMNRAAVKSWVEDDWEENVYPGPDNADVRSQLDQHLEALLADPELGSVWPGRVAPLDGALVATTRAAIQTLSLADRAYAELKQKGLAADGPPWTAAGVLSGGDAKAFANGDEVLALSAPYFFTKEGYAKVYTPGLGTVREDLQRDLWVFGADADKSAIRTQLSSLKPGVAAHYAQDYIAAWTQVVKTPQPAAYFHDPVAFGAFTRTPSPLKLLLLEVAKNTAGFAPKKAAPAPQLMIPGALGAQLRKAQAQQKLYDQNMAALNASGGGGAPEIDAGQQIEAAFRPLADYTAQGLDDFTNAVKSAGAANAAAGVASGGLGSASAQGQLATATGAIAAASAGAPPMLQGFVNSAAQGGKAAATSSAEGALNDDYLKSVAPACKAVVEDHYPFYANAAADAPVADVLRTFGLNGTLDGFVHDRLAALIDTSGQTWAWKKGDPLTASLGPASAAAFQKAALIRDMLASGVPLKVSVDSFAGGVTSAEMAAGGVTNRYETSTAGERPIMWSANALPEAHVTLYAGTTAVKTVSAQGPWALYRLFDAARKENAGPTAFKATFGDGSQTVTLRVELAGKDNPFARGGAWSFRCPAKL